MFQTIPSMPAFALVIPAPVACIDIDTPEPGTNARLYIASRAEYLSPKICPAAGRGERDEPHDSDTRDACGRCRSHERHGRRRAGQLEGRRRDDAVGLGGGAG